MKNIFDYANKILNDIDDIHHDHADKDCGNHVPDAHLCDVHHVHADCKQDDAACGADLENDLLQYFIGHDDCDALCSQYDDLTLNKRRYT